SKCLVFTTSKPTVYLRNLCIQRIRIIDVEADGRGILAALAELFGRFEGTTCYGDRDRGFCEDLKGWFGDKTAAEEENFPAIGHQWMP
ncbi:MAG: hypothetical protein Q9191_007580, partial [Dirinaria sp. TL-2023a]